jgi:hypothetical protein
VPTHLSMSSHQELIGLKEGTVPNQVSEDEYLRVYLATKRESYSHRRWPPDVVRAIIGAQIITAEAPPDSPSSAVARRVKRIRFRLRLARLRAGRAGASNLIKAGAGASPR